MVVVYGEDQFYSGEVGWDEERPGETRGTRVLSPHALSMSTEQQRGSSKSTGEVEGGEVERSPRLAAHTWSQSHAHSTNLHWNSYIYINTNM